MFVHIPIMHHKSHGSEELHIYLRPFHQHSGLHTLSKQNMIAKGLLYQDYNQIIVDFCRSFYRLIIILHYEPYTL